MKKYKFVYWQDNNKKVCVIKASSLFNARLRFLTETPHTDIISIKEVSE